MSSSFSETTKSLVMVIQLLLLVGILRYLDLYMPSCNEGIHWVETKIAKTHNSQILHSMKR